MSASKPSTPPRTHTGPSGGRPARPPLGHRFLVFWFGQTVSTIGSTVSGVGVAVWVYLETGNATWLGLLTALTALPAVLTSPLLPLVDRLPRRRVIVGADTLAAVGICIALAMSIAGRLEVWHLAVAGFVASLGTALQYPAFQAAIPSLVVPDALGRANGLNQLGPALGIVIGPLVATPLVAWYGITAVLVVDVATFVVAMACTLAVRFDERRETPAADDDGSWRPALRWLASDGRPLLVLLVAMATTNFFLAFFNVAMIGLAASVLGAARSGLVFAVGGVAMLVGSLVLGRRGVPDRRGRGLALGLGGVAVGCAVLAARPAPVVVLLGAACVLAVVPLVSSIVATVYHERVPSTMQGRVFGVRAAVGRALDPIGAALSGVVITRIAEPAMIDGGWGADSVGRLIGTGVERAAALVLVGVALAMATVAWWVRRSVGDSLDRSTMPVSASTSEVDDIVDDLAGEVAPVRA
ncbi:MAG: hypothetical protein CL424_19155 [Acidimicrobiaceae bacterium]|nr:hypothetical protein [Acidimicrobiaceae bacterium]